MQLFDQYIISSDDGTAIKVTVQDLTPGGYVKLREIPHRWFKTSDLESRILERLPKWLAPAKGRS